MSEIVYSIRVDAALVRAFAESSQKAGMNAADRLRAFMRECVEADKANASGEATLVDPSAAGDVSTAQKPVD